MNQLKSIQLAAILLCMATMLSSCEAIAGIFKAGMWTGIIVVVGIIALILYLVSRGRK